MAVNVARTYVNEFIRRPPTTSQDVVMGDSTKQAPIGTGRPSYSQAVTRDKTVSPIPRTYFEHDLTILHRNLNPEPLPRTTQFNCIVLLSISLLLLLAMWVQLPLTIITGEREISPLIK